MDLNYLYHRHQVSLLSASKAVTSCARIAHEKLSDAYAGKIRDLGAPLQRFDHGRLLCGENA